MLIIQCLPIFAQLCTIAPCITTVPSPIIARGEIIAVGCIAVMYFSTSILSTTLLRIQFFPIVMIASPYLLVFWRTSYPKRDVIPGLSSTIKSIGSPKASTISITTRQWPLAPYKIILITSVKRFHQMTTLNIYLINICSFQYLKNRNPNHFDVRPQRAVIYVPHIKFELLCPRNGIPAMTLSPPTDAGTNLMAAGLLIRI